MKLLVTGGAGFIGSAFIRLLLAEDSAVQIVNLDALTYAGNLENLEPIAGDPRYQLAHVDLRDAEAVSRTLGEAAPDAIVHFAAESHVDRSILSPKPVIDTNFVVRSICSKRQERRREALRASRPTRSTAASLSPTKPTSRRRCAPAVLIQRQRPARTCWRCLIGRLTSCRYW
jgi:dTDP-D-glucose 4,6-dehydratase